MYLSLPIPEYNAAGKKGGPVYLEECIDKFVEEETLEGSNAWYTVITNSYLGIVRGVNYLGNRLKGSL
jgi:ubiquitin C-terminal hydrolase